MIAENKFRETRGEMTAYREDAFLILGGRFTQLRELLRK
jgi:hypothetical protein